MKHRIQLKGPWGFVPLNASLLEQSSAEWPLPAGGTVKMPASWQEVLGDFRGSARFTRPFNRPTNLAADDRLELVLDGIGGSAEVRLNQQLIGHVNATENTARLDLTAALLLHNRLEITIDWQGEDPHEKGGLWAPVALEIVSQGD